MELPLWSIGATSNLLGFPVYVMSNEQPINWLYFWKFMGIMWMVIGLIYVLWFFTKKSD